MKRILFLLILAQIFASCREKTMFSVSGVIKGNTDKYIYISRIDVDTPVLLDSSKISRKGEFRMKQKASQPDFYQIGLSGNNFITLLASPGEKIRLEFAGKNLYEKYTITGSEDSKKIQTLDLALNDTKRKLDSLKNVYDKAAREPGFDTKGPALEEQYTKIVKDQRLKNIEFILANTKSLASIKAAYQRIYPETYVLYDPHDLQFLKILTDSLKKFYPNSKHVQALARDFEKEMNQRYFSQLQQLAKNIPQTKLDPDLMSIDGRRIKLSSLKGKYVLLTFWSVNSKDCIEENMQLKEYYKLYSRKGFEIYQINLDANEEDWRSAVKFDELPWISTREDDPLKPKNAVIYNVRTLPTNFLYDRNGQIIASNLHGQYLKLKLEQLFNN
jgi:hypothetical protein